MIKKSEIEVDTFKSENFSDDLNDLIGHAPGYLLRSGMTIIAVVVVTLLAMCYFIRYPDVIEATGYISTETVPQEIKMHREGIIAEILHEKESHVTKGTPIIYLENSGNKDDIEYVIKLFVDDANKTITELNGSILSLGPLQVPFAELQLKLQERLQHEESYAVLRKQLESIDREKTNIEKLNQVLQDENADYQSTIQILKSKVDRNRLLYEDGLIAKEDLENAEAEYNDLIRQLKQIDKDKVQNDIRTNQLNLTQIESQATYDTQIKNYNFQIDQLKMRITAAYDQWKRDNFLYAQQNGLLDIREGLLEGTFLESDDHIAYVIPQSDEMKIAYVATNPEGYSRLQIGSKVIIKVHNYPYKEFGILRGEVNEMASIAYTDQDGNDYYEVQINLGKELQSSYGKLFNYLPNMTCDIEIITESRSLLARLFDQFADLRNSQKN